MAFLFSVLAAVASACGVPETHDRSAEFHKTAITDAHVFDGRRFEKQTSTVVLLGGIISNANPFGATVYDGNSGYLIRNGP